MKGLIAGIVLLIVLGIGGFLYRNEVQRPLTYGQSPTLEEIFPPNATTTSSTTLTSASTSLLTSSTTILLSSSTEPMQ